MGGLINYVLETNKYQAEYVKQFTNAPIIVKETYNFDADEGLFSGYSAEKRAYDQTLWDYEKDDKGMAKMDMTLSHPRCAFNLLKAHYRRYTPEFVENVTGIKKEDFLKVAALVAETGAPDKSMVHLYALGWTHHSFGVQLIGTMAVLQLLLGNIGVPGGGIGALRGHSNVQGTTDLGCLTGNLPGYLKSPRADWKTLKEYVEANTPKPLRENSMNYWSNTSKFMVSLLKAWWGGAATKENDFAYDYLPKYEKPLAWNTIIDDMYHGKMEGLFLHGTNFHANSPHAHKVFKALTNLKWLVVDDCFLIDTAEFWKSSPGAKPESIQTEVLVLPGPQLCRKGWHFRQ